MNKRNKKKKEKEIENIDGRMNEWMKNKKEVTMK